MSEIIKKDQLVKPLVGILIDKNKPFSRYESFLYREMLEAAKKENIDLYFFSNQNTNFKKMIINGKFYKQGKWRKKTWPFPHIVYNRIAYRKSENAKYNQKLLNKLSDMSDVALFNPRFLNKWEVYQALSSNKHIAWCLPKTSEYNAENLKAMLKQYKEIFIKPAHQSRGKGIITIKQVKNYFLIKQMKNKQIVLTKKKSFKELEKYISRKYKSSRKLLIQQGIDLHRYNKRRFDLRCLVQKDGSGKWVYTGSGARIAALRGYLTHVPNGGKIGDVEKIISSVCSNDNRRINKINKQLDYFYKKIPPYLEKKLGLNLGVLSLDIGIDQSDRVWLIEVNSKPASFDEKEIRKKYLNNLMQYFLYLYKNLQGNCPEKGNARL